jgi:hypothetical protein
MLLWFAGILLYWWWVFLFAGRRELAELRDRPRQGVPAIGALKSWNTLHQAMAIHGGSVEELIRNLRRANRPMLVWYGGINLLALWILGPIVLGTVGVIRAEGKDVGWIWLGGIFAGIVLQLVATPFLAGWGARRAKDAYLAPLDLALTGTPRVDLDPIGLLSGGQTLIADGAAVLEGQRRGRWVHIQAAGTHCLTVVQAGVPPFRVESQGGKLVPEGDAPEAVTQALRRLRKAKRWQGITLAAGTQGIGIQRQSKGANMWLYDLWLAEYLVHEIGDAAEPPA